jgi:hypothetical protein
MQGDLSFVDIIGIVGFIWSFISFYIGYRWYRDSVDKDALIAKLTAENELLRREVREIFLVDGGKRRETLHSLRSMDKLGLERATRFYRAAYSFSRCREHATVAYRVLAYAVAVPILFYFVNIWIAAIIMIPFAELLGLLILLPLSFVITRYIVGSRA